MDKQLDIMMQDREMKFTEWECDMLIKCIIACKHDGINLKRACTTLEKLEHGLNTKPVDKVS